MQGTVKSIFTLALLLFILMPFTANAQKPYIDNNILILPVVKAGDALYRVELEINGATEPVQLTVVDAVIEEDFNGFGAPELVGNVITVPKLRFETKNYELQLTLVSENPLVFHLTSVREIAENFNATTLVTYSPEVCQADIELFRTETFKVQDQAEGYKGNFFGGQRVEVPTSSFLQSAFTSLRYDTILALADTQPPGLSEKARFRSPPSSFTVAPDLGEGNDPDYPVAFLSTVQFDSVTREAALYRSDGQGALSLVLVSGNDVSLSSSSGEITNIYEFELSPDGALFIVLELNDDNRFYLVKQDQDGGPLIQLMVSGESLNTGSGDDVVRTVGSIEIESINIFNQVIAKVEVLDESGSIEGFAYLNTDNTTGSNQCLSTDASILCNGLVTDVETLLRFSSDGATTGLLKSTPTGQALDYKVIANPTEERLIPGVEYQGYTFRSFTKPLVCESRNALYFVGGMFELPVGHHSELFRIDEFNNLAKITDFKSLLLDTALKGQVPDEVVDWAIGYNCDAAFYMRGPSGPNSSLSYLGHWASYLTGETVEIIDETPGRPNGNGVITSVNSSTSGIDATARNSTRTGPEGEFYFVPSIADASGTFLSTYAIASKPTCP